MRRGLLILMFLVFAAAVPGAQSVSQRQRQFDIENELERLPTYGVFDSIGFDYDRGKVTLVGHAYQGGLKSHAENAVKRVPGVDEVDNKIELLPASSNDDRIRWATFYNIYGDSFTVAIFARRRDGRALRTASGAPFPWHAAVR